MLFPSKEERQEKINLGKQAQEAQSYIMGIIEEFKKDIYNKLATGEADTILLQGQAVMLRKIESEIEKHIEQGLHYQKTLSKNKQ